MRNKENNPPARHLIALLFLSFSSVSAIEFEDVSDEALIDLQTPSFGASWGDVDGDGWLDLWAGNHGSPPVLYRNNRDGTFSTTTLPQFNGDNHGAAWGDFDNDGDQDLLVLNGAASGTGEGANSLLVNTNGVLSNEALLRGVDYPLGRGRTPLWFDADADGDLDALITNWVRADGQAPTAIFENVNGVFSPMSFTTGPLSEFNNQFAALGWLASAQTPLLLIHTEQFPDKVFELGPPPYNDVTASFGIVSSASLARDLAIGDFNGDGEPTDLVIVRSFDGSDFEIVGNELRARLEFVSNERGVKFTGSENIQFSLGPPWEAEVENIFIGSAGANPLASSFLLSSTDPAALGIMPHQPGVDHGIYVGYNDADGTWSVLASKDSFSRVTVVAASDSPITGVTPLGFSPTIGALSDKFFVQTGSSVTDVTSGSGFGAPTPCEALTSADFDNDMDLDVYLVCRGLISNLPNRLYENTGSGVFVEVPNAGGAAGPAEGRGDTAVFADFDQDGFLDLFVTNGRGVPPFDVGANQLFRNLGNANNWLQVDLLGVQSNRDGIGAMVTAHTGSVAQTRLADGAMHHASQNQKRLHFGLGQNQIVDRLHVRWPSGMEQELLDISVNQIITVTEPLDSDGDLVPDSSDNCINVPNQDQRDTNADGFGNICDPDLNDDGFVDLADLPAFRNAIFSQNGDLNWNEHADMNGDDAVDFGDLPTLISLFFLEPGPSGLAP